MADAVPASSGALVNLLANPPNPMDQLGKTANALTAAREFQAKQAIADAYRQATDPTTGQVDQGKLNAIISQTPGAFLQGQAMEQGGRGVQAQALGTSADLAARADQLSTAANYMAPLMQTLMKGGTVSTDDVNAALDSIPPGVLPGSMINGMRTKLNALGPGADASNLVRGAMFANQHAMEVLKTVGPQPVLIDTGGGVRVQPMGLLYPGSGAAGGYIPKTLTPGENIQTITVPIGNNQSAVVPQAIAAQGADAVEQWMLQNYPGQYKPGSYQPSSGAGGGTGGPAGPGRYPKPPQGATGGAVPPEAPQPPAYLQPPSKAAVSPSEAGGPLVTPTPQQPQAVGEITGAAGKAAADLQNKTGATADTIGLLNDMDRVLSQPGVTAGVLTPTISRLRQVLINIGAVPPTPGGPGPDLSTPEAAQAELRKSAALLQRAQLNTTGNPTDARQELIAESSPGEAVGSIQGNREIIRQLRGNQQAIQVMNNAWQQATQQAGWTVGGSEQNNFNAWRNNRFLAKDPATGGQFNPQVFWLANHPDVAEQKTYISKMSDSQRQQLGKDAVYAINNGWVKKAPDGSLQVTGP